jgi:aspartyl-tRNA synthetase
MSRYKTTWRTHSCGELTPALEGKEVTLCGALDSKVGDRLYELRDTYGMTRVRLAAGVGDDELQKREMKAGAPLETIVKVQGTVQKREKADPKAPTGEVFLDARQIEFVSFAQKDPLFDPKDPNVPETERIRHRYLYLRAPSVHENFRFRTRLVAEARRWLAGKRFEEIETPLLANKWTPDARDTYLAIRGRREVFALPGRNAVHGALLMAAGFDRVFEIARRFRRQPAYSAWQQPEFDVLDAWMAYVDEPNLFQAADDLLAHIWLEVLGPRERFHVIEITADEALKKYGTLAPDLRYSMEIHDVTPQAGASKSGEIREMRFNGGALRAVRAPGGEDKLVEKDPELVKLAGSCSLHWLSVLADGTPRFEGTSNFDAPLAGEILHAVRAEKGDRVIVAMGPEQAAARLAGKVRAHAAKKLKLQERKHALVRVTRLPYWRFDEASGAMKALGDPFALPVEAELEGDARALHSQGFYLVLDGVNIGGGAVKNHDLQAATRVFEVMEMDAREIDQRFGSLMGALKYGLAPHGRIAIGIDRLAALLKGLGGVSEMIPMPKMPDGTDPLTRSPWPIDNHIVRGLFAV